MADHPCKCGEPCDCEQEVCATCTVCRFVQRMDEEIHEKEAENG